MINCVYVAASTLDARLTRICVASVRHFYPTIPIKLLIGGRLQNGLEEELGRYWHVGAADIARADYGWGFVKLEPLFAPPGEKFLMLDSDTVLTGPVLEELGVIDAPFIVDNEEYPSEAIPSRYYDWRGVQRIDSAAQPPDFVFNSGQWVGTSGILVRADFDPWVRWSFPRKLRHSECFFPGEQGILNYVLSQKVSLERLPVKRRQIMVWPGNGMKGLTWASILDGSAAPRVIHWAGMKRLRLSEMAGADILRGFENFYYRPIGDFGTRRIALLQNINEHISYHASVRLELFLRSKMGIEISRR